MTSPFGVKTKTSSGNRSTFTASRNSCGSASSCCHSSSWRSQANFCSSSSRAARAPFLVLPVRRDAELGVAVHLARADLHLHALAVGADHGGVQRLVAVGLGQRDVVLEAPRHRAPDRVHDAERRVDSSAAPSRMIAEGDHVVDLVERDALRLHLRVDRGEVLQPPGHLGDEPASASFAESTPITSSMYCSRSAAPRRAASLELLGHARAAACGRRGPRARASSSRCRAGARAARRCRASPARCGARASSGMYVERAHVVEPVGELDQQDADVLRHRDQHLAEVLGLAFARRGELDLRDLGEALDQEGDLVAEQAPDLARAW